MMDFAYLWNLFVKAIGLCFYILFQVLQFVLLIGVSAALARAFILFVAWGTNGVQLDAQYETLTLFGVLLFLRQNFLLSILDDSVVRILSKFFGIAQPDLRFWEGVFEVQVCICVQIILGPIIRETHLAEPSTFEDGPLSTSPLNPRREQVYMYIICLGTIISVSAGRTGCSGFSRSAGGETGCLCRRPANSLGYTSLGFRSIVAFVALLPPNIAISVAVGLLLNGFYSVGCVVGLDAVLIYYWLIFTAVLIGFGAAAMENRKPFPKPSIQAPYFVFVNNLKAQSYILHYLVLPALAFPLFNAKQEAYLDPQNDNFRAFAILASLNMVLQIKLVIALLRLALEIQKRRARLTGPAPEQEADFYRDHAPRRRLRGHRGIDLPRPIPIEDIRLNQPDSDSDDVVREGECPDEAPERPSQTMNGNCEILLISTIADDCVVPVPVTNTVTVEDNLEPKLANNSQEMEWKRNEDELNNNIFSPV